MSDSKTLKELYEDLYPKDKVNENVYLMSEAIGFLRGVRIFLPAESSWLENELELLMTTIIAKAIREVVDLNERD